MANKDEFYIPVGIEKILKHISKCNFKTNGSLLDCGCGDGKLAKYLGKRLDTDNIFGLDICPDKVDLAIKNGIKAKVANIDRGNSLPFPKESFDLIFCNHVIEHLLDPDHLLDGFFNLLKRDGILILTTPNLAAWYNRILLLLGLQPHFTEVSMRYNVGKLYYGDLSINNESALGGHIRIFTYPALAKLLKLHNFSIKDSFSYGHHVLLQSKLLGWIERLASLNKNLSSTLCFICYKNI